MSLSANSGARIRLINVDQAVQQVCEVPSAVVQQKTTSYTCTASQHVHAELTRLTAKEPRVVPHAISHTRNTKSALQAK